MSARRRGGREGRAATPSGGMWPTVEERRVESRPQAGQVGGGPRRGPEAGRAAAPAVAVGERSSPCDLGQSSAVQLPSSRSEVARGSMERWRDRLALVTGASGGIGAAVARALVQQGVKVVGCARTVGNIEVRPGWEAGCPGRRRFRRFGSWWGRGSGRGRAVTLSSLACHPRAFCPGFRDRLMPSRAGL